MWHYSTTYGGCYQYTKIAFLSNFFGERKCTHIPFSFYKQLISLQDRQKGGVEIALIAVLTPPSIVQQSRMQLDIARDTCYV